MYTRFLRRDPHSAEAAQLYAVLASQARLPVFFTELDVADTVDGRFDLLSLHVGLALDRLAREADGVALSQSLFDAMFKHLDLALRELGVQDLGVGRRIKIMAEGFHGRGLALREGLQGDDTALAAVLARNVLANAAADPTAVLRLTRYVRALAASLAATPRTEILAAKLRFPTLSENGH
jgi:cytochrome b pre-mRNA-processing protein 3